jgi:hypothetical protein
VYVKALRVRVRAVLPWGLGWAWGLGPRYQGPEIKIIERAREAVANWGPGPGPGWGPGWLAGWGLVGRLAGLAGVRE